MTSFVEQHKKAWKAAKRGEKVAPAKAEAADSVPTLSKNDSYELWVAAAKQDWDALKAISDHAERNRRKPALLEKYMPYLDRLIASGITAQNDVLVRNVIWAVDAGNWPYALRLATVAIVNGQVIPWWDRDIPHFVTDSIREALDNGGVENDIVGSAKILLGMLGDDSGMCKNWKVNVYAHAKLHRALAKRLKSSDPSQALHHAESANSLDPNIGVKKLIEELKKLVSVSPRPQAGSSLTEEAVDSPTFAIDPVSDAAQPVLLNEDG